MSACLWETPQPTKKRRQRASRRMLRDSCVRFPCQRVSAAFRCVPGGSPDAVGAARGGSERPQSVPERLATAFACPTGRPEAFWSAWASILALLGRSAWSPGTPFAFDFRTSWHSALRLAFARATAFDQQNVKRKSGAFAFVLRLAARARPRDFHDFSHDLRGHVLFVAPR